MLRLFTICMLSGLMNCSYQYYDFHGQRYRVYHSFNDAKKSANVYAFDFSNQSMTSFPAEVLKYKELVSLNLNYNQISQLNEKVCSMQNLSVLLLNYNQLIDLPSCLYDMKQLEILTLYGCKLHLQKEELSKLSNLRILGLGGNHFSDDDVAYLKKHLPNCKIIVAVD